MKALIPWIASACCVLAGPIDDFVRRAEAEHGGFGGRAARFLVEHMPERDRGTLSAEFLMENLELALEARRRFPWAAGVPDERFFNDVLPYAVFDEPRDPWRAGFLKQVAPLVKDARTASEAARIINRDFFNLVSTHYHTGRRRTNQSPQESIEQGKATCTGLSILLVDACRAVGIPARAVGTPMWSNGRGNHTWVEIWDKGWHFMGADEHDPAGLDRGWFTADAAKARADDPRHAIYATSWRPEGKHFPMVWSPEDTSVGAENVTARYAAGGDAPPALGVRLTNGTGRIAARGLLTSPDGWPLWPFETKAGTADLNDMPRIPVTPGERYRLRFEIDGTAMETTPFAAADGESTMDIVVSDLAPVPAAVVALAENPEADVSFTAAESERVIRLIASRAPEADRKERAAELDEMSITHDGRTLRWRERTFGEAPAGGRSLWISLHGGGNAPAELNDSQWQNQLRLYQPEEGIYLAPRAPTNTWNLWHEAHIDPMFSRLIENMIALRGVDADRIYLLGYSAGGDGVWQLAPRMADRFAAAAMMAGHPNETRLDGLRNLPFALFVGAEDAAYDRNKIAADRAEQLAKLHAADPGGYIHMARIYPGLPHWMDGRDAEALPWMARFTRQPWPKKIVWLQDDVIHERFYWIRIPTGSAKAGDRITATVKGQTITLDGDVPGNTALLLHDSLLDLDQPVVVVVNGGAARKLEVSRSTEVVRRALADRLDPKSAPAARVVLE